MRRSRIRAHVREAYRCITQCVPDAGRTVAEVCHHTCDCKHDNRRTQLILQELRSDLHFPNLRQLDLDYFDPASESFRQFLRTHSSSLRRLLLKNCYCSSDTDGWLDCKGMINDMVENGNLLARLLEVQEARGDNRKLHWEFCELRNFELCGVSNWYYEGDDPWLLIWEDLNAKCALEAPDWYHWF